jgi:CBS domain containing-hemolysin-like protein
MSRVAGIVLRAFGTHDIRHGSVHSPDELKLIIAAARTSGQLSSAQEEMLLNALELDHITARQVMVPRTKIFSLPSDLSLDEALSRVVDEQHSRVPVYDPQRGPEHIVGVLYAKDLMRWMRLRLFNASPSAAQRISQMKIGQVMHDVLVVPETKTLLDLLGEFQHRKRHLAVVVDEFGSTAGVISVEDVLEQLVGELEDEFDVATVQPAVADANAPLALDGAVNIRDLETQYDVKLPQDEGFETLAGFILSRLQKMPEGGEAFDYEGRRFVVEKMDGHRIATVRIEPVPTAPESAAPESPAPESPASVQRAGD